MKSMQVLFHRHRTTFVALSGGCRGLQYRRLQSGLAATAASPDPRQLRPGYQRKSLGAQSPWSASVCRLIGSQEGACLTEGSPSAAKQQSVL